MAKKAKGFGVDNYKSRKKVSRRGRHSKSPSKSKKLSMKKYNRQGRA